MPSPPPASAEIRPNPGPVTPVVGVSLSVSPVPDVSSVARASDGSVSSLSFAGCEDVWSAVLNSGVSVDGHSLDRLVSI